MMNEPMEQVLQKLRDRLNNPKLPPKLRRFYRHLLNHLLSAQHDYEERIQELEMLLLRNPAFPGDEMGVWWDSLDDFDLEDDMDDDNIV